MRPTIHNDFSGFYITESVLNRYEEQVPEPGPQPESALSSYEDRAGKVTFGQQVRNFFGRGVSHRSPGRSSDRAPVVQPGYQRDC